MERATSSARGSIQETGWHELVEAYAGHVWSVIRAAHLPDYLAVEVNRLTWMRLADNLAVLDPSRVEAWLCETASREARRAARLFGLRTREDGP